MKDEPNPFPKIVFSGQLRPSQEEVVGIARRELASGSRRLHIVAPPGSGKTILGLYLWAELIRKPCLVLSPNSAIQSQWAARTDMFDVDGTRERIVSTNAATPELLTSLTYQSVTMPARKIASVDELAMELWIEKLIAEEQVLSNEEATFWLDDLRLNNPDWYRRQYSRYQKRVRDEAARSGDSVSLLHQSSRANLQRLADNRVGMIILDECHHLMGHWGRVLADALPMLGDPVVIGLTATPPDRDGKDPRDVERYDRFFGEVDFEVPVPSVIKDGFLAPYQDLAWFVRPTTGELKFISSADRRLKDLVETVCGDQYLKIGPEDLGEPRSVAEQHDSPAPRNIIEWLLATLSHRQLPTGVAKDWNSFARRDQAFALASRQFLIARQIELPENVPHLGPAELPDEVPPMEYWVPVIDRFVRHFLRRSPDSAHHELADELTSSLRALGIQITETGTRPCVSPVGRVLAYSRNKTEALIPILVAECENLGDSIRAVVIADFERSSAVSTQLKSLMDDETGGAISAFKTLLTHETTDGLEPILLTGSTILIDDEIEAEFLERSRQWIRDREIQVELESKVVGEFRQIFGSGRDWAPRVYVEMVTELFQQGVSKCLIGTRGLLGEGWDANKINVLIDLTTVTTSMSINQLRGRSFRLDPQWKEKTANNWDVVCIAPEFSKGFDDYRRFKDKHHNLYGVSDDGTIEKGVGHVHPAFTEIKPEGLEGSVTVLNAEMLERSKRRSHVRGLWKIGEPFESKMIKSVETKFRSNAGLGFPPFSKFRDPWSDESLTSAIASAVIASLAELGLIRPGLESKTGELSGGYIRVFLAKANSEEGEMFAEAMKQVLGPLDRPRYVIPRTIIRRTDTFLSNLLPGVIGRYFQKKGRELAMLHAVPGELSKNKADVLVFQGHWNRWVSPGEAVYSHRGEGERMLQEAKMAGNQSPIVHEKEVFV